MISIRNPRLARLDELASRRSRGPSARQDEALARQACLAVAFDVDGRIPHSALHHLGCRACPEP